MIKEFDGIILNNSNVGEYDKIITLLTSKKGKIKIFVKNARRPNNKFLSVINPLTYGKYYIYSSKKNYILKDVEVYNYFEYFYSNLKASYLAYYFLEFIDYITYENNNEYDMLMLLYYSIKAIIKEKIPLDLIKRIFELRIIKNIGEVPNFFECVNCKSKDNLEYFDLNKRSIVCLKCKSKDDIKLLETTLYTIQFIINSNIKNLYSFTLKKDILDNYICFIDQYMKKYYDYNFLSKKFFNN